MTILEVKMVPGSQFKSFWRGSMQQIETSEGVFYDAPHKVEYAARTNRPLGFDWSSYENQIVESYYVEHNSGLSWLKHR